MSNSSIALAFLGVACGESDSDSGNASGGGRTVQFQMPATGWATVNLQAQ